MIYFIIFSFLVIFGTIECIYPDMKNKKYVFYSLFVVLWLFAALRWETGTDWLPYYKYFKQPSSTDLFEIGFKWLNLATRAIFDSYTFFLLVFVGLYYYFLQKAIRDTTPFIFVALLFFVAFTGVFPVRQSLAIVIVFCSYKTIVERKMWNFFAYVLLAALFHQTAIVFLPVYFIVNKRFSSGFLWVVFIVASILSMLQMQNIVANFIVNNFEYPGAVWYEKIQLYASYEYPPVPIKRHLVSIVNSLLFFTLFMAYRKKLSEKFLSYNVLLNIYTIGLFLNRLFANESFGLKRIAAYFDFAMFILLSLIICSLSQRNRFVIFPLLAAYCVLRYYESFTTYWDLYFPYISIFEKGNITRILY